MAKITVFDDDVELSENIAAMLKSKGHTVSIINKEEGAVETIAGDPPDIAILDVMFPNNPAAGFDLARSIRQNDKIKDLPVILLTGVNQHFPMDFSSKDIDPDWMPVQDFMEKPADIDALESKIQGMLCK